MDVMAKTCSENIDISLAYITPNLYLSIPRKPSIETSLAHIKPRLSLERLPRKSSMENVKKSPRSCEKCKILSSNVQYKVIQKGPVRINIFECEECSKERCIKCSL